MSPLSNRSLRSIGARLRRAAARPARTAPTLATALLALGTIAAQPAQAGSLCPGQFQTSQLYPWPSGATFSPQLHSNDANSQTRIAAFLAGLRSGGVTVDDGSPLAMQVVFSFAPGRQGNTDRAEVFPDLTWTSGRGQSADIVRPRLVGQNLNLTIIVTDNSQYRQMWIGTMQCTIRTPDTAALAQDVGDTLGRTLAAALGRR